MADKGDFGAFFRDSDIQVIHGDASDQLGPDGYWPQRLAHGVNEGRRALEPSASADERLKSGKLSKKKIRQSDDADLGAVIAQTAFAGVGDFSIARSNYKYGVILDTPHLHVAWARAYVQASWVYAAVAYAGPTGPSPTIFDLKTQAIPNALGLKFQMQTHAGIASVTVSYFVMAAGPVIELNLKR